MGSGTDPLGLPYLLVKHRRACESPGTPRGRSTWVPGSSPGGRGGWDGARCDTPRAAQQNGNYQTLARWCAGATRRGVLPRHAPKGRQVRKPADSGKLLSSSIHLPRIFLYEPSERVGEAPRKASSGRWGVRSWNGRALHLIPERLGGGLEASGVARAELERDVHGAAQLGRDRGSSGSLPILLRGVHALRLAPGAKKVSRILLQGPNKRIPLLRREWSRLKRSDP